MKAVGWNRRLLFCVAGATLALALLPLYALQSFFARGGRAMAKFREFAIDKGYDLLVGVPATAAIYVGIQLPMGISLVANHRHWPIGIDFGGKCGRVYAARKPKNENCKRRNATPATTGNDPRQGDQSQIIDDLVFSLLAGHGLRPIVGKVGQVAKPP